MFLLQWWETCQWPIQFRAFLSACLGVSKQECILSASVVQAFHGPPVSSTSPPTSLGSLSSHCWIPAGVPNVWLEPHFPVKISACVISYLCWDPSQRYGSWPDSFSFFSTWFYFLTSLIVQESFSPSPISFQWELFQICRCIFDEFMGRGEFWILHLPTSQSFFLLNCF